MSFSSPVRSHGSQSSSTPSRSPLERRQGLRSLIDKTKIINNVGVTSVKNLDDNVKEADTIILESAIDEKVINHDEVLMDSEVMSTSSKLLKSTAGTLAENLSDYNMMDFAERLLLYVHTGPDETLDVADWLKLENEVPQLFRRTPNYTIMSGCLEPPEPNVVVKRQPARRERDALAPVKRPDAIVEVERNDDSIEQTVSKIKKLISNHKKRTGTPLEYLRLILHPHDFGKTVENMLHVSFLVRDGIMKMMVDDDGNPVIEPNPKEIRSKQTQETGNIQNIVALSFQEWQILVADLGIEVPMINFH